MKVLAFCTTFWDDSVEKANAKSDELNQWLLRVNRHFAPQSFFLATGCQDNPDLNPLGIEMVSSGEPRTKNYDVFRWSYFLCAFEAALWYAMRHRLDWTLLVCLESNCWIGRDTNMKELLREFESRPEILMAPSWWGKPDFSMTIMKRAALPRFLHHRLRGNLIEEDQPQPMLAEDEIAQIFKGLWWNPWPKNDIIRQEYGVGPVVPDRIAKDWPVVALPTPEIQRLILEKESNDHQ